MLAEVISIGDELTSGQRLDTNSQWLSERLGELGIRVMYHTTVADDLEANVQVFRQAAERADVVVATGGLGPTADDLTREAMAIMSGCELELHEDVLEGIKQMFAFFKRDMPESNRVQAMFPAGSRVIPNPHGTAPGIAQDIARAGRSPSRIYALPGVPAEMFEMWRASLAPELAELTGGARVIVHRRIKCFGAGESHVEKMLPDIIRRGRQPSVGITVSGATITLRITAQGDSVEECQKLIEPTANTIYECLGELVFGEEEDELEHAVVRILSQRDLSLATAEWGTGGMIAQWLDEVPRASEIYRGGFVISDPLAAQAMLSVPAELFVKASLPTASPGDLSTDHADVSRGNAGDEVAPEGEIVRAMAIACREKTRADLGLAVGPLPDGGKGEGKAPHVWFALATKDRVVVRNVPHIGHPAIKKIRTAKVGLNLVRVELLRQK